MRNLRLVANAAALAGFLCLALIAPGFLHAQIDTGSVTGTVTDQTGAVIPNVKITLTNDATGIALTTKSTATGVYFFPGVIPGTYTLQGEETGFQTFVEKNVIVHVQRTNEINMTLKTGAVTQKVTVSAAPPLLQTSSGTVGLTVGTHLINALPLQTRNWTSLPQLSAGVNSAVSGEPNNPSSGPVGGSGTPSSSYYSINGGNVWQNDYRLNGINNNIEFYGGNYTGTNAAIVPPPDAIQEFKVQTGDYNAQFGHSTGGVVNAALKSGTNHLHGDIWEYNRNTDFNANNFFNSGKPTLPYHQNIFGFTLGGPIVKNRTFFFGDYQGQRYSTPANYPGNTVPTMAMRNSGFQNLQDLINFNSGTSTDALGRVFPKGTIFDPATTRQIQPNGVDPVTGLSGTPGAYVRDPFFTGGSIVGIKNFTGLTSDLNIIPVSRIDPNAVKILNLYPDPNASGLANNYNNFPSQIQNNTNYDIRIDQTFNDRNTVFGTFDRSLYSVVVPSRLPGMAVGETGGRNDKLPAYAWAVGYTHVFSATFTNNMHVGMVHSDKDQKSFFGNQFGIPASFGVHGVPQVANNGGLSPTSIEGFTSLGVGNFTPTIQTVWSVEGVDNVTKVWNNHTFMTGIQVDDLEGDISQPPQGRGDYNFNGQYTSIPNENENLTGIADMLLTPKAADYPLLGGVNDVGGMSSFSASNVAATDDHRWYIGAFFQDDWKATPNLTLNLGLRWDYFTPYAEVHGRQANFIPSAGGNSSPGTYYMSNKGCRTPTSAGFQSLLVKDSISLKCVSSLTLGKAQKLNFAPRIGFAYKLTPQLVLRGGYGIAYGALGNLGYGGTLGTNYPFVYVANFNSPDSQHPLVLPGGTAPTLEQAFTGVPISDPTIFPGTGLNLYGRQFKYQTPYMQSFNLTIQDQFTNHDSIQLAYVGTTGTHLDNLGYNNSPTVILPPSVNPQPFVPFPDFNRNATYETTNAKSSYNSLQVSYEHQMSYGLDLISNFTYAKCMTDQHTQASKNQQYRAEWLPGFGINADYGLCATDTNKLFHFAGTYALPFGRGLQFMSHANRATDTILGGWVTGFIFTYQSGQPSTVGCPVSTTSDFGCFAFTNTSAGLYHGPHNHNQWLNPQAFIQPPIATTIGQSNYSVLGGTQEQIRGPGFYNLDSSVMKNFTITEAINLQFMAQAFNTFNNPQFDQPGGLNNFDECSSDPSLCTKVGFSVISQTRNNPRNLQLALKLTF